MKKTPLFASTLIAASFALSAPAFAASVTWTGSVNSTWDTNTANWSGDSTTFTNNDNVTFNGSGTGTITISGTISAGTMTVSSGGYTFSTSDGSTLTADTLNVNGGDITFSGSATIGTLYGNTTGNTITLTEGTTLKVVTLSNDWGSSFVLNAGSVLETTSATFASNHYDTVSGSGTWKADTFTFDNYGHYTFEGVSLEVGTIIMGRASSLTLTGSNSTFTIGTYQQIESYDTPSTSFAVGDGTTVNVGTFSVSWHQNTTTLGDGAVLNVTTELSLHTTATEEFTGGTINAEKISLSNSGTNASFSNGTLNIGSGGITNTSSGHIEFGDGLTVGVYNGESWSTSVEIRFTGTGTGTTFSTNTSETITLGGSISGSGFTNTGSGTLILSGDIALSSAIINSGNITISNGTTLVLDNLQAIYKSGTGYYEIIAGSGDSSNVYYNAGNITFTYGGTELSDWSIATDSSGNVWVYGTVGDLTWAGTSTSNTWNSIDATWSLDGASHTFTNGDNVTFDNTAANKTVNITADVKPGSITVSDDYTFTTEVSSGVVVDAGGSLTVAEGATLTIESGVTVYIDHEESAFSVEGKIAGSGTIEFDFTGSSTSDYGSTINLGEGNEFAGTVYIHSGYFDLTGSNIGNGTYEVADGVNFQADGNTTTSVSNNIVFDGTSQLHVNSGGSLTISGDVSGVETNGTMGGTIQRNGAGTLEITGNVDIGTFTTATSVNNTSSTTTFSGDSVKIGTLTTGGVGGITISSASATIGSLNMGTSATVTFSGSGTIDSVTITTGSATLVFTGDGTTYTVNTISKSGNNNADTLQVDSGATVNLGTLNADWYLGTIKVDGTLNISGTAEYGVGAGSTETITGTGTVTVGTLQVGHSTNANNGSTVKIDGGLTFITGAITTGVVTNNSHIQLGNTTFGTSNENGLTFASTVTEVTLTASGGEKTTFNTNVYDVESNSFTTAGTTITIGVSVVGGGDIAVTGNGTLALSGTSTLGSVTVDSGATLDLSSGTVTVGSTISNSGTVVVNSDTVFVLDNLKGDNGTYVIISNVDGGTITGWDSLTASNFSFSDGTEIKSVNVSTSGQITISTDAKDLIWNGGTSGTWDTSSENWTISGTSTSSIFSSGDSVTFTKISDDTATVNVQSDGVSAASVTVEGGKYSFVGSGTSSTENTITVRESFFIASGAEVDLDGAVVYGDFIVEGTLKLDVAIGESWYVGETGEIHGTITINNGGRVELDTGDATGYNDGGGVTAITINKGGTLYVGTTANQTLGGCELILVGGTIDGVSGSNIDLFHSSSKITVLAEDGATADTPTVSTVTNVTLTPRVTNEGGTTEVFVDENALLDVQSGFRAGSSSDSTYNGDLKKTGAGTLEVSGFLALNGGSLIIDAGTVILSGTVGTTLSDGTVYSFAKSVSVASGASLNMCFAEDTSISDTTFSGAGTIEKSGSTTLTISGFTFGGTTTVSEGTLVLTGSTEVIDVHVTSGATLDLTSASKAGGDGNGSLYIDGGTVIVSNMAWGSGSNFGANMNNCYLQISNGGVLEVTAAQAAETAGRRGFAVTEGTGTYRYSGTSTSYIAANETNQDIHIADGATLIFEVVESGATLDVSKKIANTYNGNTATTSTGSLVKTGAGTLILSGTNLYSGGTTISAGVLVAANSSALGTGTVYIDGGQLSIDSGVTITNNIEVTLSETYLVTDASISPTSLGSGQIEPYAAGDTDDGIYAIIGTGSLGSSESQVTITLFIDDTIAQLLAGAGEEAIGFYLLDAENISTDSSFTVSLSDALSSYTATYDSNTGIVWIIGAAAPEPELFSVFFGISALGMIATRRRRRRRRTA